MENKTQTNDRYANLVSVKYKTNPPFNRTLIVERDPIKGLRETCLYEKTNEINSEVCTSLKVLENKTNSDVHISIQNYKGIKQLI